MTQSREVRGGDGGPQGLNLALKRPIDAGTPKKAKVNQHCSPATTIREQGKHSKYMETRAPPATQQPKRQYMETRAPPECPERRVASTKVDTSSLILPLALCTSCSPCRRGARSPSAYTQSTKCQCGRTNHCRCRFTCTHEAAATHVVMSRHIHTSR